MSRVEKLSELTSIREQALEPTAARARLAELLGDDDAEIRGAAAAAVGSYPDDADLVRAALGLARGDAAADVRREAALALGEVIRLGDLADPARGDEGDPAPALVDEAREHLLAALSAAETDDERLAAMEALGPLSHHADVVAAIERAAAAGPRASRRAALRAMGRSGDAARWRASILGGLDAPETEVVLAAVWAAGEAGLSEAAPRLAALLAAANTPRSDTVVAARAAEALGRIGGGLASEALAAASRSATDEDVQQAARDALEELEVLAGIDDELLTATTGGGKA